MARPIRIEYPGAHYHVMARGNEKKDIFLTNRDYELFLKTLMQMVRQYSILLQAFCLMPNHYHLALTTPLGNLSQAIGWLQTTYTIRFNKRYKRVGHLFQGRYKAHIVGADEYAKELVRYIHLNPVRPKDKKVKISIKWRQRLEDYKWSSHGEYSGKKKALDWLHMEWLSYWGRQNKRAHLEYRKDIRACFDRPIEPLWEKIKGGLVLGGAQLWEMSKGIIEKKNKAEEILWTERESIRDTRAKVAARLAKEEDKRIKMWMRVRLCGERQVEVAKDYGYKDGSGVLQIIKRLERQANKENQLKKKMEQLENLSRI